MKNIAIYGEVLNPKHEEGIQLFFDRLQAFDVICFIYKPYKEKITKQLNLGRALRTFSSKDELIKNNIAFLISIGGDGTMLNSFQFVFKSNIPVFGINTGRLGFLSNISAENAKEAIRNLLDGDYTIKKRTVLEINSDKFDKPKYAVNEVAIHKQDTSSMLTIHAQLDGFKLNSYWADGLLVSTPTGSTAYSLSCGGPIVMPGSENLIITPIAPHNLAVRPLVYRDDKRLELRVESRSGKYLMAFDSNALTLSSDTIIGVRRADFFVHLLKFAEYNYLNLLRTKLMWGADKRN